MNVGRWGERTRDGKVDGCRVAEQASLDGCRVDVGQSE